MTLHLTIRTYRVTVLQGWPNPHSSHSSHPPQSPSPLPHPPLLPHPAALASTDKFLHEEQNIKITVVKKGKNCRNLELCLYLKGWLDRQASPRQRPLTQYLPLGNSSLIWRLRDANIAGITWAYLTTFSGCPKESYTSAFVEAVRYAEFPLLHLLAAVLAPRGKSERNRELGEK